MPRPRRHGLRAEMEKRSRRRRASPQRPRLPRGGSRSIAAADPAGTERTRDRHARPPQRPQPLKAKPPDRRRHREARRLRRRQHAHRPAQVNSDMIGPSPQRLDRHPRRQHGQRPGRGYPAVRGKYRPTRHRPRPRHDRDRQAPPHRRRQTARTPNLPLAVILLVGPTGTGKTDAALAVAELIFGGERFITTST